MPHDANSLALFCEYYVTASQLATNCKRAPDCHPHSTNGHTSIHRRKFRQIPPGQTQDL